jgi:hypothetical protein
MLLSTHVAGSEPSMVSCYPGMAVPWALVFYYLVPVVLRRPPAGADRPVNLHRQRPRKLPLNPARPICHRRTWMLGR